MNVTIFCENGEWLFKGAQKEAYPNGMANALASIYEEAGLNVSLALQDRGNDGPCLTDEMLEKTDVLLWWGHGLHEQVSDALVEKIIERVWRGMGVIFLHSAHLAKPFRRLLGTPCSLKWREKDEKERLWFLKPGHPVFAGLEGEYLDIPHEEMYGEPFGIPEPDELLGIGWFKGGEVFRSLAVFNRYAGKVIYFQPGHESNATYLLPQVRRLLLNLANYAAPTTALPKITCPMVQELEKLD